MLKRMLAALGVVGVVYMVVLAPAAASPLGLPAPDSHAGHVEASVGTAPAPEPEPLACISQWKWCDPQNGDPCCPGLTCRSGGFTGFYKCRSAAD
jgi:hypothetical protein